METPNTEVKKARPNYLVVFGLLAGLTAVEVGVTYIPSLPRYPILIPLAVFKAMLVVLYFMHLRFDRPVFRTLFIFGLIIAVTMMASLMAMFAPQLLDPRP